MRTHATTPACLPAELHGPYKARNDSCAIVKVTQFLVLSQAQTQIEKPWHTTCTFANLLRGADRRILYSLAFHLETFRETSEFNCLSLRNGAINAPMHVPLAGMKCAKVTDSTNVGALPTKPLIPDTCHAMPHG